MNHIVHCGKPFWCVPACQCCGTYHDAAKDTDRGTAEMDGQVFHWYDCRDCRSSYVVKEGDE